jgi:hypothetical protein
VNGQWLLDLVAMSRSKNFSHLFPDSFPLHWNDVLARKVYGCADVTRYYIDIENNKFFNELSKLKQSDVVHIDEKNIPEMFLDDLGYYDAKPVWEEWDFPKIIKHQAPSIYKAFERYAHKKYTLLGFGLMKLFREKKNASQNCSAAHLLSAGENLLNEIVLKIMPRKINFKTEPERAIAFFELEQELLETVSTGTSIYVPTDANTFTKQLKGRMKSFLERKFLNNDEELNRQETFSSGDRKNINKYLYKIGQYLSYDEDFSAYRKVRLSGTYREKVFFIHSVIGRDSIREYFSERELKIIYGLINKISSTLSFDQAHNNNDNDESLFLHDIIQDEKNISSSEHVAWTSVFTNAFEHTFRTSQLEEFLHCIPEHFAQYPFDYNASNNISMNYYSRKKLFSTFCAVSNIEEDKVLWGLFNELMQQVIDKLNDIRKDIRSEF